MEEKLVRLTVDDITDLNQGLVILMKVLDKYKEGTDKLLSDRLDVILKKIERQTGIQ